MYNILCGINYLHTSSIMHRDIKPSNLLINDQCIVKLCDFGFSRDLTIRDNSGSTHSVKGHNPFNYTEEDKTSMFGNYSTPKFSRETDEEQTT